MCSNVPKKEEVRFQQYSKLEMARLTYATDTLSTHHHKRILSFWALQISQRRFRIRKLNKKIKSHI